tara:strand:- start:16970 stop:17272 length:303 start_codon:yes stop_codon:yes gene_type:complete
MHSFPANVIADCFELIGIHPGSDLGELLVAADTEAAFRDVIDDCEAIALDSFTSLLVVGRGEERPIETFATTSTKWHRSNAVSASAALAAWARTRDNVSA